MISARVANTGAASFSFLCLLLVNLGTPIIKSIFIASVEMKGPSLGGKIIFGIYGACAKFSGSIVTSGCANIGLVSSNDNRNVGTKFLLSMHAVGVVTSFMLFYIGMYTPMGGQIDNYLKIKNDADVFGTTTIGTSGFILVILPLLFSFISIFAFYMGDQAAGEGGSINGPGNMAAINNQSPVHPYQQPFNQPPVPHYNDQQSSPPPYTSPQYGDQYNNYQFPPPQSYPNSQYGNQYNNYQSPPPQSYPNSQYDQYNAKQNPYSRPLPPLPPQSPQSYTDNQPYSSTDHEPAMM
ncbi:4723_t:CDS:2 [Entrophospora sp. SA101]|nr:830_t:CDS:2 [Entrophospora sp. SA101]CAJ0747300.1 11188_t:CDS:2 [Entrophospora sp. SA101]CAJ0758896.1 1949_t:CDS:2 [Entrophospora sp. SA101]CAJ0761444.1 4723_t:CDS:2 [Entrophospora sp. SA101]